MRIKLIVLDKLINHYPTARCPCYKTKKIPKDGWKKKKKELSFTKLSLAQGQKYGASSGNLTP